MNHDLRKAVSRSLAVPVLHHVKERMSMVCLWKELGGTFNKASLQNPD
jgi:hypothetical protein